MKFASFLMLTAAGLAIAAPITPVSPSKAENKLTVEPIEVVRRQLPDTNGVLGPVQGGLPKLPVGKRQVPDTSAVLSPVQGGLPKLPVGKRQLGGLTDSLSGSSAADSAEDAEPKEPKEPKEPGTVTDGTTEIDTGDDAASSTDSAASALGGLPVGKRQLDGITGLLDPAPADPVDPEEPAEDESAADEPAEEEPTEEEPVEEEPVEGEEEPAPPAEDSTSMLSGLFKRQLGGLTSGLIPSSTPKADDATEDADTTIKSQTNKADDGTNGTPAPEETTEKTAAAAKEAAPAETETVEETAPAAKNATEPAPAKKEEKKAGLLGSLGM